MAMLNEILIAMFVTVGSGHEAALRTFQRVVQPAAARFQPDIILVCIPPPPHAAPESTALPSQGCADRHSSDHIRMPSSALCLSAATLARRRA